MIHEKRRIRAAMRAALADLPCAERARKSEAVRERVCALPAWRAARAVLCYLSLPDEVSTDGIVIRALAEGKTVGVPRIAGGDLAFHRIDRLSDCRETNRYGIREPAQDIPLFPLTERYGSRFLVVVPGLAFDRSGNRLGRGRGFYDRFLGTHRHASTTVGICFSLQLLPLVPAEPHDRRMDFVVTDRESVAPAAEEGETSGPSP